MSLTVRSTMPPAAQAELRAALARLHEGPGLASRLADVLGTALGGAGRLAAGMLGGWGATALRWAPGMDDAITAAAQTALSRAFDIAVLGLPAPADGAAPPPRSSVRAAGFAVAASGAAGGAAGLIGFAPDAAVTTLAIMRRIARVAQEEGEDLSTEGGRRAVLEVFALRAGLPGAGAANEAGYFPTRLLLQGGSIMRLLAEVAARYGVQLGQKLAAQAVPVAGAACGAAINAAFMAQYDGLARAHFTVRRLEREWGAAAVADTMAQWDSA